jgi:hypothetical protein
MGSIVQDVRHGIRLAARSPALALTVALTLAFGLGANVAVFAVIQTLLLRAPDGVQNPGAVVSVHAVDRHRGDHRWFSYAEYRIARDIPRRCRCSRSRTTSP